MNEVVRPETEKIQLPDSMRLRILAHDSQDEREHPDIRLARRAQTMANLARVIGERKVRVGIRRTLWAQARRLETLARERLDSFNE